MDKNILSVKTSTNQEEAVKLFKKYDLTVLPVIDKENILGIDDVVRVLPSGKCDIIDPREIQYRLMKK